MAHVLKTYTHLKQPFAKNLTFFQLFFIICTIFDGNIQINQLAKSMLIIPSTSILFLIDSMNEGSNFVHSR